MNKPGIPENLRPEMQPVPIADMPGVSCFFGFTATAQACDAAGVTSPAQLMAALLRGEAKAIEESVGRALINSDGSRWQAGADAVPVPTLELGRILADGLHRRLFGQPLIIEGDA